MPNPAADPAPSATGTEVAAAEPARDLPRVDARAWAIGFLIFGIVLAVVLSQTMIGFLAAAHATP
ncbi:MAG TPA: hypothetical protein VH141_28950 [Pseudonocardia sp.]|jgi:hypothetical protein|nr:hypothetical protein [Pseudonocardia sp.]